MEFQKKPRFLLYIMLGFSLLLNLAGMASIASAAVTWIGFLMNIIDIYRAVFRDPLAYIGNMIWPFGIIPKPFIDYFIINSVTFFAYNIIDTLYKHMHYEILEGRYNVVEKSILKMLMFIILIPILFSLIAVLPFLYFINKKEFYMEIANFIELLFYVMLIVSIFIVVLFVNYQFKQLGY